MKSCFRAFSTPAWAAAFLLLFAVAPVHAATLYVAPGGTDTGSCLDENAPCASIAYAVSEAQAGDVIDVTAGTYVEVLVILKDLTIRGAGTEATVVDGGGLDAVFDVQSGTVTIRDLTITGGKTSGTGTQDVGGGVRAGAGTDVTLVRCAIRDNEAALGAGVFSSGGLTVQQTTISADTARGPTLARGGALYVAGGSVVIRNSTLSGNEAQRGGGVFAAGGVVSVFNSTVTKNDATAAGGGLYNDAADVQMGSTLWAGNSVGGTTGAPGAGCTTTGGSTFSAGYNLVASGAGCPSNQPGDQRVSASAVFTDVIEPTLADHGGPTRTHALRLLPNPAVGTRPPTAVNTPAASSTDHSTATATNTAMPSATDSRKAVFITDHGSTRRSRSRALRTRPRRTGGGVTFGVGVGCCG